MRPPSDEIILADYITIIDKKEKRKRQFRERSMYDGVIARFLGMRPPPNIVYLFGLFLLSCNGLNNDNIFSLSLFELINF